MKFILSRQILFGVTPKIPQRNKCNTSEEAKSLHLQKPKKKQKKQECIPVGCVPLRLWPVSPGMHFSRGGVPGPGEVYLVPGWCTWSRGGVPGPRGVYLVPGGCTWSQGVYLVPGECTCPGTPPDRITDACENITLPQLRCGR